MSIQISNFSMGVGEIVDCVNLVDFSVDIIDTNCGGSYGSCITTSGTYFTYNGEKIQSIFTTISGGYRLSYSTTPSGNVVLGLQVHNTNNEYVYKEYKFNFGYYVEWSKVVYWGTDRYIPVSIQASNDAIKPNTAYFSTFFHTHKPYYIDFNADTFADGVGINSLPVFIKPQSKYFEYGRTYTVTISGIKDFSGNVLDVVSYSFRIEDQYDE